MTDLEKYEGGTIVTRTDLRNAATDSWTEVLKEVGDLAVVIAPTDFVPESFRGSVPAVAATILTGRELGFAPMMALSSLHSIKGKVGLSAEAMRALVLQAGHEIVTTTSTSQQCTMKGKRKGASDWTEVTWTTADARAAGLLNGNGWKNYPRQMLQARASTELCRLAFPDVIRGLASLEEITDYDVLPGSPPTAEGETTGTKPTPVKRAPRKKAPTAEPADPPPLPDAEQPAATTEADAAPAPDLPDTASSPGEPQNADAAESPDPAGAHEGEGAGEAPPGDEVLDAEIVNDEDDAVEELDPLEHAPINQGQMSIVQLHFNRLGIKDREQRLMLTCAVIGRIIDTSKALTFKEATALIHVLETSKDAAALEALIEAMPT